MPSYNRAEYYPEYLKRLDDCVNLLREMKITTLDGYGQFISNVLIEIRVTKRFYTDDCYNLTDEEATIRGFSPEVVFGYMYAIEKKRK